LKLSIDLLFGQRPIFPSIKGNKFKKEPSYSYDRFKLRSSSQILEEQRNAKQQKIRKIIVSIILIIIALASVLFYFSK
jgi:hypothetical protein